MIYRFAKRTLDVVASVFGLALLSPIMLPVLILVWAQDRKSPFYLPQRIGEGGNPFTMYKIRSMVADADKSGVDSTSNDDPRITPVGKFIRKFKLDELSQLINVVKGDMSLVGPRPNVQREVILYTDIEQRLLTVKPGITDPSSIVFSDLGTILNGVTDANLEYNQKVRPWKSRLSIFYIEQASFYSDFVVIGLTIIGIVSRERALAGLCKLLRAQGAPDDLLRVASRRFPLMAAPPPGSMKIVESR